jgi:competence protein ComEA
MLSRLMTRREQLLLLIVGASVLLGAAALYVHDRNIQSAVPEVQAVQPPPADAVAVIPLEQSKPLAAPLPEPLDLPAPVPEPPPPIGVSVAGAVRAPGLYKLDGDVRVKDLLDKAKGPTEEADLSDINLAAKLIDGTTLTIPARGVAELAGRRLVAKSGQAAADLNPPQYTISGQRAFTEPPPSSSTGAPDNKPVPQEIARPAAPTSTGPVDLNTATAEMLEALPGIGPKTVEKIMAYRTRTPFTCVDDLANVSGIGPKKLEMLRPLVTVRSATVSTPGIPPDAGTKRRSGPPERKSS